MYFFFGQMRGSVCYLHQLTTYCLLILSTHDFWQFLRVLLSTKFRKMYFAYHAQFISLIWPKIVYQKMKFNLTKSLILWIFLHFNPNSFTWMYAVSPFTIYYGDLWGRCILEADWVFSKHKAIDFNKLRFSVSHLISNYKNLYFIE